MNKKFTDFLHLNIYQIYPRSFCDSNGDGVGDIPGIISKLDYLKELGINAIWLCPCFKSPQVDNGYDISDYRDIYEEYGTMDDIRRLFDEAHKRQIKIILDLVPNHTSSQHKWFRESRKGKDNPYSDYYYWVDEPLNDWQSGFCGSVWQYDDMRKQYYLHSFAVEQPDLNWENPKVVKEMQDIVDFWVDLGADGFRIDVIDQISKDFDNNINTLGPRLHEYIKALFGREKTKHIFTVGECYCSDIDEVMRHIAPEREELSTLFQFEHFECGRHYKFTPKPQGLKPVRDILTKWQNLTGERDIIYSLLTDNHDNSRYISRVGNDRKLRYESATCIATMFYLLKGIPFIYQGQEIGMTEAHYDSIEDFLDIESLNLYNEACKSGSAEDALKQINFGGRDNSRRPMPWNDRDYGGFSKGKPWITPYNRYKEINLEKDLKSEKSVFTFYRDLLKLRSESEAFITGEFMAVNNPDDSFFAYTRTENNEQFLVICNFEEEQTIELEPDNLKPILTNYPYFENGKHYRPYEIRVFKVIR